MTQIQSVIAGLSLLAEASPDAVVDGYNNALFVYGVRSDLPSLLRARLEELGWSASVHAGTWQFS